MSLQNPEAVAEIRNLLRRRHLRAGWAGLLIFLALGMVLETLQGFKTGFYVDSPNATRRLMWTLAHAHGTLFALVNIAFAVSLNLLTAGHEKTLRLASKGLLGGLVVLPLGFFLGGFRLFGSDPGVGVFLVPVGATLMLGGVTAVGLAFWRKQDEKSNEGVLRESDVTKPGPGSGRKRRSGLTRWGR